MRGNLSQTCPGAVNADMTPIGVRSALRVLSRLLIATALAAGASVALSPSALAADVVAPSFVSMVSDSPYYFDGRAQVYTAADKIRVYNAGSDAVHQLKVEVQAAENLSLLFSARDYEALIPGTTYTDRDFGGTGSVHIGDWSNDEPCNEWSGEFTVLDLAADYSRAWLRYRVKCFGEGPSVFGEVRVNVPAEDSDLLLASNAIEWPTYYPGLGGKAVPVAVTNVGVAPLTVSEVAVATGAADFSVVSSDCGTLAPGASCRIHTRFVPSQEGARSGSLTIATSAGDRTVTLTGRGQSGHSSWTVYQEAGTGMGAAQYRAFTPSNSFLSTGSTWGNRVSLGVYDPAQAGYDPLWMVTLEIPEGQQLAAGQTWRDDVTSWYDAHPAGLINLTAGTTYCTTHTGQFTIHEVSHSDGDLERLSATFEHYCDGSGVPTFGSVTYRASDPAPSVGGVVGSPPSAVSSLAATPGYNDVTLTWRDPAAPDWAASVVRGAPGRAAPATPTSGFAVPVIGKGKAKSGALTPGSTYSFSVFARDTEGKWSPKQTVTVSGASLTLAASTKVVDWFSEVAFTGELRNSVTGAAIANKKVNVVARRPGGTTWFSVGTATTNSAGRYKLKASPAKEYEFFVVFDGASGLLGDSAGPVRVKVAMGVAAAASRSAVPTGKSFQIGTVVGPTSAGKTVQLQELRSGSWITIASGKLLKDKATFFKLTAGARGTHKYRVIKSGNRQFLPGTSRVISVKVT